MTWTMGTRSASLRVEADCQLWICSFIITLSFDVERLDRLYVRETAFFEPVLEIARPAASYIARHGLV